MQLAFKHLYDVGGWANARPLLECDSTFIFACGGRGIGKTFSMLRELRRDALNGCGQFVLLRRLQAQADFISKPDFSPFKPIDAEYNWCTTVRRLDKFTSAFYVDDEIIGYVMALSTINNIRGFSGDVSCIFYDEFIPEAHARSIKHEADALWNAYETINRNREIKGLPATKLIGMSNSNTLDNEIFISLGVVDKIDSMKRRGQMIYTDERRGLTIIDYQNSEISRKKRETALYRLTRDSDFADMALSNDYPDEYGSDYRSISFRECVPLVTAGELTVYRLKSDGKYYVSTHEAGTPQKRFGAGSTELIRFKNAYFWLWQSYLMRRITFENRMCEILFRRYFDAR